MTLTYVRLATERGTLLLPNSSMLSAVIGPIGVFEEEQDAAAPLPAANAPVIPPIEGQHTTEPPRPPGQA